MPWPSAAFKEIGDAEGIEAVAVLPRGGVYALVDEDGTVVYIGRSKSLADRRRFWAKTRSHLEFRDVARTDSYAEQRGLEQRLINKYRPELNMIRGISRSNPRRGDYLRAARDYYNRR